MSNNKEILGLHRITKAHLKDLCKKHRLYQTPHLNDQLYLHYQGFQAIENLDEYTGLKCLWLESNAISEIQGLQCLKELKCLFLQNNLIRKIEHLEGCYGLDTLNLASNHITKIENCGVDVLPVLSTLNLSRNQIQSSDGLKELVNCKSLWSLDLSHNRIDDILVVKIFASIPELRVLVLQGNPVVNRVPQYRKTLILECKNLTYLDSRPVFPKDRACAEAWKRGGYEEERKEHERWNRKDRRKIRDSVNATLRLRRKNGDEEVQLLPSTDDEDEEKERESKELKSMQGASADLEITGLKAENYHVALEMKGEEDEQSSPSLDDSFTSAENVPSSRTKSLDVLESQIITTEEMVVVEKYANSPVDEVVVQDVNEEAGEGRVDEQAEKAPTLIDHEIVCEDEEDLVTQSHSPAVVTKAVSSERSAHDINSDTSSSSSEMSSVSDSSDTNESDAECDDVRDDSLTKEDPIMGEVIENQLVSGPLQQAIPPQEPEEAKNNVQRGPQGPTNPSDPDYTCNNSMSFDELVESQSFSYMETLNEQRSTLVMTTNKNGTEETAEISDEEDSGLVNSLQTASSFSEIDNHDDATLTCETPTKLCSTESSSQDDSGDDTLYQEASINPEDLEIPADIEVNDWLKNFLAGLKAEQDRDHDDTSSVTDSSLEDCSDGDTDDEANTTPARVATISEGNEDKSEKVLDSAAEGEIWLKSVLTSSNTEEGSSKTEEPTHAPDESTQGKGLPLQAEATDLFASIFAETQLNMDDSTFHELQEIFLAPSDPKSSDEDDDDDSSAELSSSAVPTFSSTLRDGLDSFNKVVETINKRREERLQKINDFVNHPLTKADALQSEAQLDQQIEQIKQEKHERVRQLVEHVYAQKDEYDDTLELIEGRLMVVKRGTGALEEVQPPPSLGGTQMSSQYVTHGVSTNSVGEVPPNQGVSDPISPQHSSCSVSTAKSSLNGSESDDYGTPLSGDERNDEDEEVEQHQSDTKISRTNFPSMVNEVDSLQISATRTSSCGQDEVSFEEHFREEQEESLQRVMELHRKIDADIFTEVSKWMDEGGDIPSVSPAVKRGMGREEVMLLRQQVKAERAAEDALEGVARIFEVPSGHD